jgi:putative redox protein
MNQVQLNFSGSSNCSDNDNNELLGELKTNKGILKIGTAEGEFLPYQLLMGALGSCLYSTFLDIIKKMRMDFCSCTLDIEWEKRTETPTTCKLVIIKAKIKGSDIEKKARFNKAFELATEYCSIYCTLSHVAELKWELAFE